MKCIFINKNNIINDQIILEGKDAHHLMNVFRIKDDDSIEIKDNNYAYQVKIGNRSKNKIIFNILNKRELQTTNIDITVCQGILKGTAFHLVLQKLTELGISNIIPFKSEFSIVNISTQDEHNKLNKWQTILEESSKQCGRDYIPIMKPIITNLKQLILNDEYCLIAHEKEQKYSLKNRLSQLNNQKKIMLLIGPEGGFSDQEIEQAKELGFHTCYINDNVLRSETASISIVSNILYHFMD